MFTFCDVLHERKHKTRQVLKPGTPEHRNTGTPEHSGTPRNTGTPEHRNTETLRNTQEHRNSRKNPEHRF